VARFFKYKTLDELFAENERLGIDLAFSDDMSPLFQPLKIGSVTVGNRLCIHPMEGCDGTLDGRPDELTIRRYVRFGAGGAKVIWGEATAVVEECRANPRQIVLNANTFPTFADMVQQTRKAHRESNATDQDLLFGLQLTHSGRYSYRRPIIVAHDPLLDPRTVADKVTGRTIDPSYPLMTDAELEALIPMYVSVAKLAQKAGFDFVDVKQCHRYLLNELLGARNREGKFGGSLENRTRLPRMIIEAIRSEVPGLMITTRMNIFDGVPFKADGVPVSYSPPIINGWGVNTDNPLSPDITEVSWWINEMRTLGVSLINATMGNPYAAPHFGRPFEYPPPDGYEAPEHPLIGVNRQFQTAAQLQRQFPELPLTGTGYSYLQEFLFNAGAANVRDGKIAIIGVGRASLSQPDFAKQLMDNGKLDRKRVCRTFSYCTALMRAKQNELGQFAAGCPPFDKEVYGPIWQEVLSLKKNEPTS